MQTFAFAVLYGILQDDQSTVIPQVVSQPHTLCDGSPVFVFFLILPPYNFILCFKILH